MPPIAVVGGAGYVGLAYSVLLADLGHEVVSVDMDPARIGLLCQGVVPNHEPGLDALLTRTLDSGRLRFTTDYAQAVPDAEFVFICVGTPSTPSGAADTSAIADAAQKIARHARNHTIVVNKSTMPVGSASFVSDMLAEHAAPNATFAVVSNPEFLREGSAIHDIYHPDRIVLGSDDMDAAVAVGDLYRVLGAPLLITQPRSAEMIKYASNAFLANKISFINEVATICEQLGADISAVVHGMGLDARINPHFLRPGIGFGGSCFPKDVRALAKMARDNGCDASLLTAVLDINEKMRHRVLDKIKARLGSLNGRTIGVLGLAFKPETDDIRESPAVALVRDLVGEGASVRATDPVANRHVAPLFPTVHLGRDAYDAAMGADALVLVTEWSAYRSLDLDRLANAMRGRLVIDGRNVLEPGPITEAGLIYEGMGRGLSHASATIQVHPTIITALEPSTTNPVFE